MPKTKNKTENRISIPAAIRDEQPTKKSASDLLSGLTAKAKKPEKKTESKKQHPELALETHTQDLFSRFAQTKQVFDVVEGELKAVKGELNDELFGSWVAGLFAQKAWPSSPAIKVRDANGKLDAEGLYVVQEKFKLQIPDEDNPANSIIEGLIAPSIDGDSTTEPLSQEDAELVVSEIDFSPQLTLRPFGELVSGHYVDRQFVEATDAEKAVGQKLLEFVTNNLTEEEKELVLISKANTTVKKGVLDRVAQYVKSTKQLFRVFQYLVPVNYPKGAKFGVSDTPVTRTKRLVAYTEELLGSD
ncbi:MAG: hypothetical protein DWQ19_09570 [Crenarchaeota archaeon]|nr:MAG: hypothetical protein DWQ19_09570 [Thermoproteota archaeon]